MNDPNQPMDRREILKMMALTFSASVALPESAFAKLGEPLDASAREPIFHLNIFLLYVSQLAQALPKCRVIGWKFNKSQITDSWHFFRLLRLGWNGESEEQNGCC